MNITVETNETNGEYHDEELTDNEDYKNLVLNSNNNLDLKKNIKSLTNITERSENDNSMPDTHNYQFNDYENSCDEINQGNNFRDSQGSNSSNNNEIPNVNSNNVNIHNTNNLTPNIHNSTKIKN